ncbi:serine/threonine-protein kinase [Streptomyces sp. NPDC006552]|uniref:serine/threonine-protein kinase n=1 Tax=Streptomyces sp. NPDC006552 TaxID=3157179 RepID=UPI0033B8FD83
MNPGYILASRYQLTKRLGRGGMGEVWAARDRDLRRDVAVKLLDVAGMNEPELQQRFEREGVAAAQINHPNVAALYDRGMDEDMIFLVMEKVEGTTLAECIDPDRPLHLDRALAIAAEICEALVAAHRAHVIHYDIKPQNVMITDGGRVKVVDFGIAGFLQSVSSLVPSAYLTPAGTPQYGAPEQFLTERGDARSDLYSLGSVLFGLLAGRPPFTGHSALALIQEKLADEAPRIDSVRDGLPPAVVTLVTELLRRDPDSRPQTARQVYERLQQLRSQPSPEQPHEPPKERNPPGPRTVFAMSWTGSEPLATYTKPSNRLAASAQWLFFVSIGVWLPLDQHKIHIGGGAEESNNPWTALFVLCVLAAAVLLLATLILAVEWLQCRPEGAWSLRVSPAGVKATGKLGEREYPWDEIRTCVIEKTEGISTYEYTALWLNFVTNKELTVRDRVPPAGWTRSHPKTTPRKDGLVPVCILGPMTESERTELDEALARYTRE